MWFTRNALTHFLSVFLAGFVFVSLGCSPGVQSGDINATFTGVNDGVAVSPTAANLTWRKTDGFTSYDVYANYQQEPILTGVSDTALIENLQPSTSYKFKVTGKGEGVGTVGGDREISVQTWPRFTGISSVKKDEAGNIVLSWDYDYPAQEFLIYYQEEKAPTAANTNDWASPQATTSSHTFTLSNLKKSIRYYFVVQARYRGTEYERPTKSLSEKVDSSFPTPAFELSPITIGTLPSIFVTPVINNSFLAQNYTTKIYKDDLVASDPLIGDGQVSFSSTFNLQLGKVDNITLKVTYNDGKINETVSLTGLSTYLKGITDFIDLPAQSLAGTGQAFIGDSMTTGDFNCDGYDDLAVGLPRASLAGEGSNTLQTGAVYVYYGGYQRSDNRYVLKTEASVPGLKPLRNPYLPGIDPQIITLDDLGYQAQFGKSLSGRGNLNGDTRGAYSCDDLIVGAPMVTPPGGGDTYGGAAFVFFGGPEGLKAPRTMAAMAQNTATCDGRPSGATCTAAVVWPNYNLWPDSEFGGTPYAVTREANHPTQANFGQAVSYIGDFNADGYDDFAVGAPNDIWHGRPATQSANTNWVLTSVGSVTIFFGSKFGLGKDKPTASGNQLPFVRVYPPIAQPGMQFGYSIAGGVDVDGGYRVKATDNTYKGGADFVVGAPNFYYAPPSTMQLVMSATGDPEQDQNIAPGDGGWWGNQSQTSATNPRYGFSQSSTAPATATGAAFVYFGRARATQAGAAAGIDNDDSPTRSSFWKCGRRGMDTQNTHFSCLNYKDSYRMLFPRNNSTFAFGKSVAMLGMKSVRNASDAIICATPAGGPPTPAAAAGCSDPNGDGYGEIIVGAPESNASSPSRSSTGVLWEFFGNPQNLYEAGVGATENFKSGSPYYNSTANCSNFSLPAIAPSNFPTDKSVCAPTLLIPNSILSNTRLGLLPSSLAVGDLNGDGIVDLGVGAEQDDTKAANSGAVYGFLSVPGQGVTTNYKKFILDTAQAADYLGRSVAIGNFDVGSVNFNDVVAGAPHDKSQRPGGGAIYQFLSGNSPLAAVRTTPDYVTYDYVAAAQRYNYGSARIVGDVNGDGYDDAVTHISGYDNSGARSYDAVINFGSPIGLITTSFCLNNVNRIFKGGSANASECYPSKTHNTSVLMGDYQLPQMIVKSNNISAQWAEIGFGIGDINGDGYADVMFSDSVQGQHVVYFGTRGGLQDTVAPSWLPSTNDPQLVTFKVPLSQPNYYGSRPNDENTFHLGSPVAFGDFNGDGFSDVVIGNSSLIGPTMAAGTPKLAGDPGVVIAGQRWACDVSDTSNPKCIAGTGPDNHGGVTIYYGSRRGLQTPSVAGASLGADTDINNPSAYFKDLYTSETNDAQKTCTGSAGGNLCVPGFLRNPVYENISYGYTRLSHEFGASVTVLDIDKDGYDDLLVSAPGFEQLSCNAISDPDDPDYRRNTGRVYIFKGSQYGILAGGRREYYQFAYNPAIYCGNITPADDTGTGTVNGTPLRVLSMPMANWDPYDRQTLEQSGFSAAKSAGVLVNYMYRSRENSSFGTRIVNIGDVNGDGYEDLAVSAPYESNLDSNNQVVYSSGAIYIYYGPLCGTDNDSQITDYIQSLSKVNQSTRYANNLTDPGISTVPLLASCKAKPLAPQKIYVKDAVNGENFGLSVIGSRTKGGSIAGDANLDGFSDVVVGSPNSTEVISGTTQNGRGIIYFGSQSGIFADDFPGTAYEITTSRKVKPYILQPPVTQKGSRFFKGNLTSGDVNGDKAMDIMVPSTDYDVSTPDPGIDTGTFFMFY